MKQLVRIYYESDFTINNSLPNGYDNEDFIIRLYTTDESSYYEAKFIEGTAYNCTLDGDKVTIYVNNHGLNAGCLHIVQAYDYDNNHFADGIENIKTSEESNIYLVKSNPNSTSAMFKGSALPDLTGASDYITEADLNAELAYYITFSQLETMSYVTSDDLNDYLTEEELNDMGYLSQAQLEAMGYATTQYVDSKTGTKQDILISGVNIKTINGNSLLGSGNLVIEGGGGSIDLSAYVTKDELSQASYVSQSQLSQAGYLTTVPDNYATKTYVADYVDTHSGGIDLSSYVTKTELSQAGYATETYVSDYVAQHAPTPDMSAYVTKTELSNASYATSTDLVSYLNISNFNRAVPVQLSVVGLTTKTTGIPNIIEPQELTYQQFIATTNPWVGGSTMVNYVNNVIQTTLNNASYITSSDLSNAGYVTETSLANMSYVTETALSNKGYLTSIPSEYVTESELSAKSYATTSQLAGKQDTLVSGTNIKTVNNNSLLGSGNITISSSGNLIDEVTMTEYSAMQQAGTLDPNTIYVITDAPATDLSYYAELTYVDTYYVSKDQLNSASYVTASDLSNMSYATTTQLANKQDNLISGTNIKTVNNESLLGSGNITIQGSGEANVIESISVNGTTQTVTNKNVNITVPTNTNQLTNGAGFLTSAIFQYDSSTYTLSIIV